MTLLASTLIVGSMTGCGSTKLTKSSITIELGNEDAIKISYLYLRQYLSD